MAKFNFNQTVVNIPAPFNKEEVSDKLLNVITIS